MPEKQEIYLGNPNLKRANVNTSFTPKQVKEFIKCSQDPVISFATISRSLTSIKV